MTSVRQISEAAGHKLHQRPCEEVNPQLINAYIINMSHQHRFSHKWRSVHICVFIQKCSIRNVSVPSDFHSQQQSLHSVLAASEDLSAFKNCRFQALLPNCSQTLWLQAKLLLNYCFTTENLQKQVCLRPRTLAAKNVLCIVQHKQVHLRPPLTTLQPQTLEPNSHTNQLWLQDTPVWKQNVRKFLYPVKLMEMQRPLCQSVL